MKVTLLLVGKTAFAYLNEGVSLYAERLKHYCTFNIIEIPELKGAGSLSEEQIKTKEGDMILKNVRPQDELILLDERGKAYDSVGWARHLEQKALHGSRDIVFVIGGAYGFSKEVYDRSDDMLSLSRMTFSHQIVRVIFIEQLYRAFTIIRGEPYHHR